MVALQMERGADESLSFKNLNTIVSALSSGVIEVFLTT